MKKEYDQLIMENAINKLKPDTNKTDNLHIPVIVKKNFVLNDKTYMAKNTVFYIDGIRSQGLVRGKLTIVLSLLFPEQAKTDQKFLYDYYSATVSTDTFDIEIQSDNKKTALTDVIELATGDTASAMISLYDNITELSTQIFNHKTKKEQSMASHLLIGLVSCLLMISHIIAISLPFEVWLPKPCSWFVVITLLLVTICCSVMYVIERHKDYKNTAEYKTFISDIESAYAKIAGIDTDLNNPTT